MTVVFMAVFMVGLLSVWLESGLGQRDVAADGAGLELDVVLAVLGGSDALDARADPAGDRVDVGPDGGARRDADLDVAAGALGADLAPARRTDRQVAAAGGQRDVGVGGDDAQVAGACLDDGARVGGADLDVARPRRDVELTHAA